MASLTSIPGLDAALANIAAGSLDGRGPDENGVRGTFVQLPFDREFRVEIVEAKTARSQAGNEGIRYTVQVTDHPDNAGYSDGKVWGSVYFTGHEFQGQQLATLLGSAGASASTFEDAVRVMIGGKLVIALKEGNDPNYPDIRWLNIDKGQKIRLSGIKPKGGSSSSSSGALTATLPVVVTQANATPQPTAAVQPSVALPTNVTAPADPTATPAPAHSGIRLPGT